MMKRQQIRYTLPQVHFVLLLIVWSPYLVLHRWINDFREWRAKRAAS